ncbi:metal-dependent transcriptional regulator [Mycoplasmatota bacterium]|nr:metal-dependent transcriptional regulator [Mycoplasmatota bacterium]
MTKLSQSIEDYIEHIYILSNEKGVRITDLAKRMNVSKASANDAVKRLVDMKYVTHQRYGNIFINDAGKVIAEKIIEKHRIISQFLSEVLGVSSETADKDACEIEHIISEETFEKIKDKLS